MTAEQLMTVAISIGTLLIAIVTVKAQLRKDRAERDAFGDKQRAERDIATQLRIDRLEASQKQCDEERSQLVKDNYRLLKDNLELSAAAATTAAAATAAAAAAAAGAKRSRR